MNIKSVKVILMSLVILGFFFRIVNISSSPPEFFNDEITDLLSARSILDTGKDINGKFQFYFYNRLELGPPIYGYIEGLASYVLGENALASRFPAVIFGTLTIVLVFLLTQKMFHHYIASLGASFAVAFSPWAIHFSRVGWEPSILNFFLIIPILLFKKFTEKESLKYLYLSSLCFAFAIYTNRSAEFLAPLFFAITIFIYWKNVKDKILHLAIALILFAMLATPFVYISSTQPLMHQRAIRISTFAKGFNRESFSIFTRNYLSHLQPKFLFINGDPNLRQSTGTGVLYWSFLIPILTGLAYLLKNIKTPESKFIILWLILFPLGGSLTNDGFPHATRTLIGLPPLAITLGLGIHFIYVQRHFFSKIILCILAVVFILEFLRFTNVYYLKYPERSLPWWEYGQSKIFSFIKSGDHIQGTVCMENLNYWNEETLKKFYIPDTNLNIISGNDDQRCQDKGAINVFSSTKPQPPETQLLYEVKSPEGGPYWKIYLNL